MKLVLIRGLPGSGKSTLAKGYIGFNHYEADMFFNDQDGIYRFDYTKIKEAHEWCFEKTKESLINGLNCVVSNTFVKKWEMQKYVELAKTYVVELEIVTATGEYDNVHDVPPEVVERMKSNFETF